MTDHSSDPIVVMTPMPAPPVDQIDESCAGVPLDAWRRGDPYEGVMTAVRFVAQHPDIPCLAYCHLPLREMFDLTDRRQKAAGKAWAAREFPHLNIRLRQATMPYQGVGSDVVVIYAEVQKSRKPSS